MTPPSTNTCSIQILVSHIILQWKELGLFGEMILGLGHEIYKISLEHVAVTELTESKDEISFFFLGYDFFKNHIDSDMTKGRKANWKSSQWPKLEQFEKNK